MTTQTEESLHTAASLAERLGGEIVGRGDLAISGVNAIGEARPDEITFIVDAEHARQWPQSRASVAIVTRTVNVPDHDPDTRAIIFVDDAEQALIELLEIFAPPEYQHVEGIHASAVVHPDAALGECVSIGPHVTVESDVTIGDHVVLHPGVRLYRGASIGDRTVLHANVVVRERCVIGLDCVLHSGVAIGTDGFGYRPAADGSGLRKMPHIGNVILEDRVEIGANTCIDRAKFGATVIGFGTKIDNLVQIGHNCRVGRSCVIAALSGLSGSVTLGEGVQVGGNVGIADHVTVGDRAKLAGKSGIMRDVPPGETVFGTPAQPLTEAFRQVTLLGKLRRFMNEVRTRLKRLEDR